MPPHVPRRTSLGVIGGCVPRDCILPSLQQYIVDWMNQNPSWYNTAATGIGVIGGIVLFMIGVWFTYFAALRSGWLRRTAASAGFVPTVLLGVAMIVHGALQSQSIHSHMLTSARAPWARIMLGVFFVLIGSAGMLCTIGGRHMYGMFLRAGGVRLDDTGRIADDQRG